MNYQFNTKHKNELNLLLDKEQTTQLSTTEQQRKNYLLDLWEQIYEQTQWELWKANQPI